MSKAHAVYARRIHTGTAMILIGIVTLAFAAFEKIPLLVLPAAILFIAARKLDRLATTSHAMDICPGCDRDC